MEKNKLYGIAGIWIILLFIFYMTNLIIPCRAMLIFAPTVVYLTLISKDFDMKSWAAVAILLILSILLRTIPIITVILPLIAPFVIYKIIPKENVKGELYLYDAILVAWIGLILCLWLYGNMFFSALILATFLFLPGLIFRGKNSTDDKIGTQTTVDEKIYWGIVALWILLLLYFLYSGNFLWILMFIISFVFFPLIYGFRDTIKTFTKDFGKFTVKIGGKHGKSDWHESESTITLSSLNGKTIPVVNYTNAQDYVEFFTREERDGIFTYQTTTRIENHDELIFNYLEFDNAEENQKSIEELKKIYNTRWIASSDEKTVIVQTRGQILTGTIAFNSIKFK